MFYVKCSISSLCLLASYTKLHLLQNVKQREGRKHRTANQWFHILSKHVTLWHTLVHVHAQNLCATFALIDKRKNKFLHELSKEEVKKLRRVSKAAGRPSEGGEMMNKKRFKFITFLLALHMQKASSKLSFSIKYYWLSELRGPQMKMTLNYTCTSAVWAFISGVAAPSESHHLCWTGSWFH